VSPQVNNLTRVLVSEVGGILCAKLFAIAFKIVGMSEVVDCCLMYLFF